MLLTELNFEPRDGVSSKQLRDAVMALEAAWAKNGQIWGPALYGSVGGKLRMVCLLPEPSALHEDFHSAWARRELEQVAALTRQAFTYRVVDEHALSIGSPDWRTAASYTVITNHFDRSSPIAAARQQPVPLYRLPIEEALREELLGWMESYRELDGVYLGSGALELAAYRELAVVDSELSQQGRRLAAAVESATGVPTYYYLFRGWGRADDDRERRCPGCGGHWAIVDPAEADSGVGFPFRCTACRLVSDHASSVESPERASIGEWTRP